MTQRNGRKSLQDRRAYRAWGERLDSRILLSGITVIVRTTAELSGAGSLRSAINQVDTSGDPTSPNSIVFQIPKTDPGYNPANGTFTIHLRQVLPPITKPAFIDGTTETTFLGQPGLVVIDGSRLKSSGDGLTLAPSAPGSTIDGLEIANFAGSGIVIGSPNNTIGGTAADAGNILVSNTTAGVSIPASATGPSLATNNLVLGNFIGTNASGFRLGNGVGVLVTTAGNTIGGTASGAANIIGFSSSEGIQITGTGATNNLLLGNLVGTNATGANLGNPIGVSLETGPNTIGGTSPGAANVFGFNTTAGLQITVAGATNEVVIGNLFGTNATGDNVGNVVGLLLQTGSNTIGGTSTGAANVFGFNTTAGLQIAGAGATNEVVIGNLFGTDAAGANLGNAVGMVISSGGNTIGGSATGAGNIFSFNSTAGVQIAGTGAAGNVLIGNLIGTDGSGQKALGNDIGILVSGGTANVIGGATAGAGNVISGNFTAGIELTGDSVSGTQIVGNRIGTDPTGTHAVVRTNELDPLKALQNAGVVIIGSAGNVVGGTSSQAGNLISGNYVGVMLATITGQGSPDLVLGNLIGTDASGSQPLGNIVGIYINGASGNQVGGTGSGSANTISGNSSVGVEIYGSGSRANLIDGNIIGLAANGQGALRRKNGSFVQATGVFIQNASNNLVGGSAAGAGNVISGNESAGVYIDSHSGVSSGNIVVGNRIGLAADGTPGPGNDGYGVLLLSSPNNQIQLTGPAANRFGRNGIANDRNATGSAAANARSRVAASTHGSHRRAGHPAGPARHWPRISAAVHTDRSRRPSHGG